MKCKKCHRELKYSNYLKGTAIEQQKICIYCGCKNSDQISKKTAFKDALSLQLQNLGKTTEKILNDATAPLKKIDEDMKKAGF